jgi:RNA polymerase subunit RPABC4/transcription elongation factor Spt4
VVERVRQAPDERTCPWCESADVTLIQRGYARLTDEVDQYLVCAACKKITYEIVAKTAREMRLGRYKAGDIYQDRSQNTRYTISRVLRSGPNEFLLYLKPKSERAEAII